MSTSTKRRRRSAVKNPIEELGIRNLPPSFTPPPIPPAPPLPTVSAGTASIVDTGSQGQTTNPAHESNLDYALRYAGLGLRVVPNYEIKDGKCSCGEAHCDKAGKHPRIKGWVKDASNQPTTIRRWLATWQNANLGIATGRGRAVIDIDPDRGGAESIAQLESEIGPLPRNWNVGTGGDGEHIYLMLPPDIQVKSVSNWRPGIDIKGEGGQVIAPPSRHLSGKCYQWLSQDGDCPPAIPLEWLRILPIKEPGKAISQDSSDQDSSKTEFQKIFNNEVQKSLSDTSKDITDNSVRYTEDTEDTECLVLSELSVSSVYPGSLSLDEVISRTIPIEAGWRHRQLFEFARYLQSNPEYAKADGQTLKSVVRQWHSRIPPNISTTGFDETWLDFREAWDKVKFPVGQEPIFMIYQAALAKGFPEVANQYEDESLKRMVALCRELQDRAGSGPFYLSCRGAGMVLGIKPMMAWKWLRSLERDKVLEPVSKGKRYKASEFRYLGDSLASEETVAAA